MGENPNSVRGQWAENGPRVGVTYRIVKEELSGEREKYDRYLRAITVDACVLGEVFDALLVDPNE